MLDIKFIRENKEIVKAGAVKKKIDVDIDALISFDDERRKLLTSIEQKKAEQNKVSEAVVHADASTKQSLIESMKTLKQALQAEEEALKQIMQEWQKLMIQVPNIPDMSVPDGASDADNKEIRTWGTIPTFSFTPQSHVDLMTKGDMVDFERGAKVAGFRGYFLKNGGAKLNFALWQFVVDFWSRRGFSPIIVPSLVRRETLLGSGYIPQGEEDLYRTQDNEYLSGTGEVAGMSLYSGEVVDKTKFPIKMLAFSPCFRREAGSHGKDTKGLIRVHEFFKFEQLVLCEASHEKTVELHEEITRHAEEMMQALGIPYRVVLNCGADIGLGQVKKYDIEAWVPSENTYRETHSASYFHDFQTRRLDIRYRDEEGKMKFAHSLNNTAAATPRLLVTLIENYQNEDGSIRVPEALRPYMGTDVISS